MAKKLELIDLSSELSLLMTKYQNNTEVYEDIKKVFDIAIQKQAIANDIQKSIKELAKQF